MLKKHFLPIGLFIGIIFMVIATSKYPGGSQKDSNSIGYDWKNNYISNLFTPKAVNGVDNPAPVWAAVGMLFVCGTIGAFFVAYSKRIPHKSGARVIKFCGAAGTMFAFFAITPYHDTVIVFSSFFSLLSMFYVTIFILKSKMHFFKLFSIVAMLMGYACNYIFFARTNLEILPVMQKLSLVTMIAWCLSLYYFTSAKDFAMVGAKSEDKR